MAVKDRFGVAVQEGLSTAGSSARRLGRSFVTPEFLQGSLERASRLSQWVAATMLLFIVPILITIITLFHRIIVNLVFGLAPIAERGSTPFVLTLFGLGLIVAGVWFCFQWVRTAGFGLIDLNAGGSD